MGVLDTAIFLKRKQASWSEGLAALCLLLTEYSVLSPPCLSSRRKASLLKHRAPQGPQERSFYLSPQHSVLSLDLLPDPCLPSIAFKAKEGRLAPDAGGNHYGNCEHYQHPGEPARP
jgi:hypothetical protein